jgi:MinD-like ATPase involved in chromosome partitioning or flagellar assembly
MDPDRQDAADSPVETDPRRFAPQSPWHQPPSPRRAPGTDEPAGNPARATPAGSATPERTTVPGPAARDAAAGRTGGQTASAAPAWAPAAGRTAGDAAAASTPDGEAAPDGFGAAPDPDRPATGQARWSRRRIGMPAPIPEPFPVADETPVPGQAEAPPPIYVPPTSSHHTPASSADPLADAPTDRLRLPSDEPPRPYRPSSTVDGWASPTDRPPVHPYPELQIDISYPVPTADELTARRIVRPREWVATTGMIRLAPGRRERDYRAHLAAVRRAFGGLRQVTVVNPKGGAGKTVATLMLGLSFGQARGGFVLAWDNNETQGTLGMRAQVDGHHRTVRDLLRDLHRFEGAGARIGELSAYVRAQQGAAFDVLASDESATAGEMLTATAFREIRAVVGRFYRLLLVDTGNNARADNWQAALDATDQLVIAMSARNDSAETAARLLDHLEQTGRRELVRRAVAVISLAPHRADLDPKAIERHFSLRCRAVLRVPYDRHLDEGGPVDYGAIAAESRRAWLRVAAAVADGL